MKMCLEYSRQSFPKAKYGYGVNMETIIRKLKFGTLIVTSSSTSPDSTSAGWTDIDVKLTILH